LNAKFLTLEERAQAVLRIRENHSGIEQKFFKRHQFIEALRDPKSWLYFLHAWSQEMANVGVTARVLAETDIHQGITNQYSLIIKSFGFTVLQTTLLGCVTGLTALGFLLVAALTLWKTRVGQLYQ
jgi:hypothetical protein